MGCCHSVESSLRLPTNSFHLSKDGIEIIQFDLLTADYKCVYSWDSPVPQGAAYCTLPAGQLFAAGGRGDPDPRRPGTHYLSSKRSVLYDPPTSLFSQKPDMTIGRDCHCLAVEGRAVYAISGQSGGELITACERFDIVAEEWEGIEPLPEPRVDASACVVRQRIYVTGGHVDFRSAMKVLFYYIPVGQWVTAEFKMPVNLKHHGSAEYKGGVLVFGGVCDDGGPNVDTFWFSTRQNRVLQKCGLPAGATFPCQCISTGDRVFACEAEVGRTMFVFVEDQWRLQNFPLAGKDNEK